MKKSKEEKQYKRLLNGSKTLTVWNSSNDWIEDFRKAEKLHKLVNTISKQSANKILKLYRNFIKHKDIIEILHILGGEMFLPALHDGHLEFKIIPNLIDLSKKLLNKNCPFDWIYTFKTIENHLIYLKECEMFYLDVEFENEKIKSITIFNCIDIPSFDNLCKKEGMYDHYKLYSNDYNKTFYGNAISIWAEISKIEYFIEYFNENMAMIK